MFLCDLLKHKLLSIMLLLTLVVPLVGTYWVLQKRKKIVRKEIKWKIIEGIDKKELVCLSFSKTDVEFKLKWKHSKEFEFEGEMYDIVEKQESKDSFSYWCWWDYEETQLNKSLSNVVGKTLQNDPYNKLNKNKLLVFFKSLYTLNSVLKFNFNVISKSIENKCENVPDVCKGYLHQVFLPPIV